QAERMSGDFFPSASEYTRGWGLTNDRYKTIAGTQTLIMHPGPMNRGLEISAAAADSVQNTALEQVANGVSVRMAVLYLLHARQAGQLNALTLLIPISSTYAQRLMVFKQILLWIVTAVLPN